MKEIRLPGVLIVLGLVTCALGARGKPTIAVFDFNVAQTVKGKITIDAGDGPHVVGISVELQTSLLTDKLIAALIKSQKLSVVEREKFALVRHETELSQAGLTDPNKSVEFGKVLGADYFLLGSLSMLDGEIRYEALPYEIGKRRTVQMLVAADIRIVETRTGKILCAHNEKLKWSKAEINPADHDNTIPVEFQHEGYDELVRRLVASTIDTLFPIKVASVLENVVYLNRADLQPGTKYEIVNLGDMIRDPDTGEVLGQKENKLAVIRVTEGLGKFSTAEIVSWVGENKGIPEGSLCRLMRSDTEASPEPQPQTGTTRP